MSNIEDFMRELAADGSSGMGRREHGRGAARSFDEADLVRTIWEESGKLGMHETYDAVRAWEKVSTRMATRRSGRIMRLRTVAAAAAVILLVLFATRFLIQDAPAPDPGPKLFAGDIDAQDYAYEHLYQIAENVLASARAGSFERRMVEMAGEQFDGDHNVLIRELMGDNALKGEWADLLRAFYDIEGANYFPQVYIPDHANYFAKPQPPVAVIHVVDKPTAEGRYIYDAFKADRKGRLRFYKRVSEEDIDKEKILVFSLNERVGSDGTLMSSYASVKPAPERVNCRIDKMQIRNAKESWAGGSSEIHVRAVLEYWNGLNNRGEPADVPCDRTTLSPRGVPVRYFSRDEIQGGAVVDIDYHLHDNWDSDNFLRDEVAYRLLIFEEDVWPNGHRQASYALANGVRRNMAYASAQEHYTVDVLFGATSPPGWTSPVYPEGVHPGLLIHGFEKSGHPEIYYTTETY